MKNRRSLRDVVGEKVSRALEAKIALKKPRKGFHHASLKSFLLLKKTDILDLISSNDYYAFCWNNTVLTCRMPEHGKCRLMGYCVLNPLEVNYRDFIVGGAFIKKGTYLDRRIQGKTDGW